jgi:hypothetical protein
VNSENTRSRMEASSGGKREYGDKGRWVQVLGMFGLLDFTMLWPGVACQAF